MLICVANGLIIGQSAELLTVTWGQWGTLEKPTKAEDEKMF